MPTTIILSCVAAARSLRAHRIVIDYCGSGAPLAKESVAINRVAEIAPIVRDFGNRMRTAMPGISFSIFIQIAPGQRPARDVIQALNEGGFALDHFIDDIDEQAAAQAAP
jgi:hypothetical protein